MSVKTITTDDLRWMDGQEGLVLQGCGGSLEEWVDGINGLLTESGILLEGTKFQHCASFRHDGVTCLLFSFEEDVKLDIGKLAMWRLQSYSSFGGTWLSDFVPNRLGGFVQETQERQKPDCPLIGQDGNIFHLLGIAARTLRENDMAEEAKEMQKRIYACGSYGEALNILGEYVNITGGDEPEEALSMDVKL